MRSNDSMPSRQDTVYINDLDDTPRVEYMLAWGKESVAWGIINVNRNIGTNEAYYWL
jgi:hypothetical protein